MPVILKEFRVPPPPPVLPPPPANFVGVYQLGGPGHGSRPPLFGPPVTGRTQVSASERTPETQASSSRADSQVYYAACGGCAQGAGKHQAISGSTEKGRAHQTGQIALHLGGPALSVLLRACPLLKRSARECSAKAVEKLECSAEAVEKLECRVKATVEGNLECFALGACCWRCPEATPYLNGSTKCLALPRCSTMRRCAAAFLGFLSKVVGFRFCLLLGVCFGATVVRWSGGFVFGSRRKRACKRWVRVTLTGRIVRHSLPVKGKHSRRPMMRVLRLVRKVLEKFTAPRVRCRAEAQWTPEAERVVHRSRMLAWG